MEGVRGGLSGVPGQHHAAHIQPQAPEHINESQHVLVVGDAQVAPDLVLLDVPGVDGDDDLHVLLQLQQHPHLAVRLEARQHPGGVIVVKQLAAELQIQLAAELADALPDLLRLHGEIFLIVKSNTAHIFCPSVYFISSLGFTVPGKVYHAPPVLESCSRYFQKRQFAEDY